MASKIRGGSITKKASFSPGKKKIKTKKVGLSTKGPYKVASNKSSILLTKASAYANNDVAILFWKYDSKIDNCLGFKIERIEIGTETAIILPAWVGFKNQTNKNWDEKD